MYLPNRIISVDFETTGIKSYDDPIALSCVVMEDAEPTGEVYRCRIKPGKGCRISVEALQVQGLDLAQGVAETLARLFPPEALEQREVMAGIAQWVDENNLRGLPCVSHKASFDMMFYEDKLARNTTAYAGAPLGPVWICTKQLAKTLWPDAKKVSLDACLLACGLPGRTPGGHDATEDALLCGRLYFELKKQIESTGVKA